MKKLLSILIMLLTVCQAYGPGMASEPSEKLENWLHGAPLNTRNLQLALDITGVMSPDIVIAQAMLETGHFSSELCLRYNNLFGMKLARRRQTTALGATDNNYAFYRTWYDSVKDVRYFQQWYISTGRDLSDYFAFLREIGYAEDPVYIRKVKELCSV